MISPLCLCLEPSPDCYACGYQAAIKHIDTRIGFLRQSLNEDRITDTKRLVDNAYIERWLEMDETDDGYAQAIKDVQHAIIEEMNIARSEGQPTSRLTSLFNKLDGTMEV